MPVLGGLLCCRRSRRPVALPHPPGPGRPVVLSPVPGGPLPCPIRPAGRLCCRRFPAARCPVPAARPGGRRTVRPFGAIPPTSLRSWAPPAHEPRAATPSGAHPGPGAKPAPAQCRPPPRCRAAQVLFLATSRQRSSVSVPFPVRPESVQPALFGFIPLTDNGFTVNTLLIFPPRKSEAAEKG